VDPELDCAAQGVLHLVLATAREWPNVGADVHGVGADLRSERGQLPPRRSVAQKQPAAALPERGVELAQALEQELCARTRGVAPAEQAVVETEHRHDGAGGVQRRAQRRVVVHPQVAPKPDEGGHEPSAPSTAAWR